MNKISTKLLLVFILAAGLPLVVSSIINVASTRQLIRANIENTLNAVADFKLLQINAYLENQKAMVQQAAKSPSIFSALSEMPEALEQGVDSEAYMELDLKLRGYLNVLVETGNFDDIYLISAEGDVLFSLKRKSDFTTNLTDGPYDSSALADAYNLSTMMFGTKFVGYQPYQPSSNDYAAFFAVPVFGGGYPVGVFAAQLRNDALFEFSADYTGLYETGETMLLKPELEQVLLVAPLRHDREAAYQRHISSRGESKSPIQLAASGGSGSGTYIDYREKPVISAWRYLPKLQWGMVVKIDEHEVYQAKQYLINQIMVQVIISLVIVIGIAVFIAHGLSRPITQLLAATRKIAAGDLNHQVPVLSGDEIGQLSGSFNDMTRKLKHSHDKSEAAIVAKDRFLSTMSHEIRTPMNGVIGMVQLLEDTPLTDEQKDYLGTISRSGNSLLSIINDILDFSKLDAEMIVFESIAFDLERVCQESMELIAGNAVDKELELIFDYRPECPRHLLGDPSRFRQVLLNLLGNALKFTEDGFIRLGVSCEADDKGNELIRLEIQDSGIGLNPEAIKTLFDEFTQADTSTTRKYGGTGLGLAITKKLVTLMGGEVGIDSVYGEGTTFWITVQLPKAEVPTPPLKVSPLEGVRVLFVDDNRDIRRIFKRMLEHMGTNVTILSDPTRTLDQLHDARLANDPYKIAILDHIMPDISGMQLGIEIRSNVRFDKLKLLIFSTTGKKGDASLFAKAGFNAYLNRLCRYETLRAILSTMLDHSTGQSIITQHSIKDAIQSRDDKRLTFKGSILLVEDVLPNQIIAKKFLSNMGLDVDVASDGQQAIDAYNSNTYDLVFMDCRMPIMDGYEATRAIRALEKEHDKTQMPVIALTANTSNEDRILCEQAGMNAVVTKPFKRADLSTCLQQWLPQSAQKL